MCKTLALSRFSLGRLETTWHCVLASLDLSFHLQYVFYFIFLQFVASVFFLGGGGRGETYQIKY